MAYDIKKDDDVQKVLREIERQYTHSVDTGKKDENGLPLYQTVWNNDRVKQEYEDLKKLLEMSDSKEARRYIISKRLANTEDFSRHNLKGLDDYRGLKNKKEFKAPSFDDIDKEGVYKGFFDKNSPNYHETFSDEELDEIREAMGLADMKALRDRIAEEQTKRDRYAVAHGEDLGGWFDSPAAFGNNLFGLGLTMFAPRTQEAIERGEDPSAKDVVLDLGEDAFYVMNPSEKAMVFGAKAAPKAMELLGKSKTIERLGKGMIEPFTMEAADALVYGDENPRGRFNPADVGIGTIVNAAMGKMTDGFTAKAPKKPGLRIKNEGEVKPYIDDIQAIRPEIEKLDNEIEKRKRLGEPYDDLEKAKNVLGEKIDRLLENMPDPGKLLEPTRMDKARYTIMNQLYKKAPGVGNFVSNRTGDYLSENPKNTKRMAKGLLGVARPVVGQQVNDLIDSWYINKDSETEREKLDKKTKDLLGYGLSDWRGR